VGDGVTEGVGVGVSVGVGDGVTDGVGVGHPHRVEIKDRLEGRLPRSVNLRESPFRSANELPDKNSRAEMTITPTSNNCVNDFPPDRGRFLFSMRCFLFHRLPLFCMPLILLFLCFFCAYQIFVC
jgi:hypothetical protein